MNRHGGDLEVVGSADVLPADAAELNAVEAGYERRQIVMATPGRQRGNGVVGDDVLPLRALYVDRRCVPSHKDCFSDCTN